MPPLQIQARALGDPTRHRIFEYLDDAARPVGVAELTEHFGLNHNAIRQHLAKLVVAELVVESAAAPSGRGRPRLEYMIAPATESRWGVVGPYERLSMLLTEIVRSGDTPVEVGRRAGRQLASESRPDAHDVAGSDTTESPVEFLVDQMARQGFDPEVHRQDDRVDITLGECPFSSAVLTDADTVCQLHLGMAQGIAEAAGGVEIDDLERHDPRTPNCRLRCHVRPA